MEVSPKFLRFAAVCAAITALTTLAIHLMPHLWADVGTFERQLDLRNRVLYLTRLWIVLIHCLLVVISMYAVCLLSVRAKPGWAGLGFLAFFVFALTEIFRTSLALFALNRSWRTRYAANPDPETRGSIRAMIEAFAGINDALFFIFIVAFFLGLLCYGVALSADKTSDRGMGFLFLTWAVLTLPAIIDAVRGVDSISGMFEWVGYGFQPIARASIGVWLWKKSSALHRAPTAREISRLGEDDTSGTDGEKVCLNKMIAIAGIPWDENSSFMRGPSEAPPLIRAALFSQASGLRSESGIDFPPDLFVDAGDVPVLTGRAMLAAIEDFIAALLDRDLRPLSLGGDHAVTYPIIKAISRKYCDLTILQFDAHADLYDTFEGNRYSHACPFARIMEEGLAKRLVQVGVRTLNGHEQEQANRFWVEIIEMKDWAQDRVLAFDGPVYLSFDLDVLDPANAPGVSHQEPGGFTTRQVINTLLALEADVVGADIVEFNPRQDVGHLTENLAAKLAKEIAAKMLVRANFSPAHGRASSSR